MGGVPRPLSLAIATAALLVPGWEGASICHAVRGIQNGDRNIFLEILAQNPTKAPQKHAKVTYFKCLIFYSSSSGFVLPKYVSVDFILFYFIFLHLRIRNDGLAHGSGPCKVLEPFHQSHGQVLLTVPGWEGASICHVVGGDPKWRPQYFF